MLQKICARTNMSSLSLFLCIGQLKSAGRDHLSAQVDLALPYLIFYVHVHGMFRRCISECKCLSAHDFKLQCFLFHLMFLRMLQCICVCVPKVPRNMNGMCVHLCFVFYQQFLSMRFEQLGRHQQMVSVCVGDLTRSWDLWNLV